MEAIFSTKDYIGTIADAVKTCDVTASWFGNFKAASPPVFYYCASLTSLLVAVKVVPSVL